MKSQLTEALEAAALTLGSAVLFLGFFSLNDWFFSKLAYREGVNWIFLPAGFRVMLVLVLGLQGALGIMLGSLLISRELFNQNLTHAALLNALVSGFTPWLVMKVLESRNKLHRHLRRLTSQQIIHYTLLCAATSALAHQAVWQLIGWRDVNIWVDVWPMFIGDALGALIVLYSMKWALSRVPLSQHND